MEQTEFTERIKHGLIVSCQAEPEKGSHLYEEYDIARMASESLEHGACAVRVCGYKNVKETRQFNANALIIGIAKGQYDDGRVLITEALSDIEQLVDAGADVIGMDATRRRRPKRRRSKLHLFWMDKCTNHFGNVDRRNRIPVPVSTNRASKTGTPSMRSNCQSAI